MHTQFRGNAVNFHETLARLYLTLTLCNFISRRKKEKGGTREFTRVLYHREWYEASFSSAARISNREKSYVFNVREKRAACAAVKIGKVKDTQEC